MANLLNKDDITIVVNTCDAYEDVLDIFFYAMQDCWPDCPYPVVINAESKSYCHPAEVHHYVKSSSDDWGARLRSTLQNINSEYVMMVYDDFILDAPVNNLRLFEALGLLKSRPEAVVVYLISSDLPVSRTENDGIFTMLKNRSDYRLNSAPAIWRRQSLIDYTSAGDTPWAWEVFGTYRTWDDGREFYCISPSQSDIYPYNHRKGGAIYRGKWVLEVVEDISRKYPINIDWGKRGFSSDSQHEKRSLMWKLRFMKIGFEMVGVRALYFLISYVRGKLHV